MKNLLESQKKNLMQKLNAMWYFESWFEKLLLIGITILGCWKLLEILVAIF